MYCFGSVLNKYNNSLGFGVHLHALSNPGKVPFAASFDVCQANAFQRFVNPLWRITESLSAVILPWRKSIPAHLDTVNSFAYEVIEQRRQQLAAGETYKDLLSHFMKAKNQHGEPLNSEEVCIVIAYFGDKNLTNTFSFETLF